MDEESALKQFINPIEFTFSSSMSQNAFESETLTEITNHSSK